MYVYIVGDHFFLRNNPSYIVRKKICIIYCICLLMYIILYILLSIRVYTSCVIIFISAFLSDVFMHDYAGGPQDVNILSKLSMVWYEKIISPWLNIRYKESQIFIRSYGNRRNKKKRDCRGKRCIGVHTNTHIVYLCIIICIYICVCILHVL